MTLSDTARAAERSVLGSMLRNNLCIADVAQNLREESFSTDANRKVWSCVVSLYEQGRAADLVTVANLLRERGQTADVPHPYLADLLDEAPTTANVMHHARQVRESFIYRDLAGAAAEIAAEAREPTVAADELLERAEQRIFAIADVGAVGAAVPVEVAVKESCERIDARASRSSLGLLAGLTDLDEITAGFQECELTLLAARPSVGKTSLGLSIARNVALAGHGVFFASLEQGRAELGERLLASQADVDGHRLRHGRINADERARLAAARDVLDPLPMFIDDSGRQSVLRIASNGRRLKHRHGIKLIIVDYLGLIEVVNRKDSRQEQVAAIVRSLKLAAKELRLPVLCLAQLNRDVESRGNAKPKLSDLRDSGAQEQDADTVLLLWKPEENGCRVDLIVAKQRNGRTGEISLAFRKEYVRFENFAHEPAPFARGYSTQRNGNGAAH